MTGLLMLALMMLISHFGVSVGATNYHAAVELHRSMARYHHFFQHEDTTARSLLQVDQKLKDNLDPAGEENSFDPDEEKDAFEFQQGLDLEEKHKSVKEIENPTNKTSPEQQQVDKKIDDKTNTTEEGISVDIDDKLQLEQDLVETLVSVQHNLEDNPTHDHIQQQQQQEKQEVNGDTDVADEENSIDRNPERQLGQFPLGEEDVAEEDVPKGKSRNVSNPKHESFQVQKQVDEMPQDNEKISSDREPKKLVKEGQLRPDAIEREPFSGNQEVEKFEEEPHLEGTIHNSDSTRKVPSTGLESREKKGKESQLGQDVFEKHIKPGVDNLTESQTDKKAPEQHLGKEADLIKVSKQKTVQGKESSIERPTEENSDENPPQLDRQQQQEEGSEKDVEFEQEEDEVQQEGNKTEDKESFVFPEPYLLGPKITDWDEQRADWFEQNPHTKSADDKPKVLIVTGSQPEPCRSSVGDYFHIQSLKLKMDYARMHNYEIYYNFAWLDPLFGSYWVKLPIIRKLMVTHPEIEWLFWIDSDAMFTDMLFEAPFHTYEGYNLVMWGWNYGVYGKKLWTAFNAGVFIIRNCQWSLDLIDKWSPMGPNGPVREEYGHILTAFLTGREKYYDGNYPADDQSALVYLMITDEAVKAKVKLVEHSEYMISGWWIDTLPLYNTSIEKYHPGFGDYRWPFITHFTGCSPCGGDQMSDDYRKCMEGFQTAYNFADNQVLAFMGFQHDSLLSPNVTSIRNETGRPLELVGINPWEERIAQVAAEGTSGP